MKNKARKVPANGSHIPYGRHKVTFEADSDIECIVRAELGQSTLHIAEATGLTSHQVNYRIAKAKVADGYAKGQSYRTAWRNGTSPAAKQIFKRWAPSLSSEVGKRLPTHFLRKPNEQP